MLGSAVAPATLLFLHATMGWRGAFLCAAALGVVAALFVFLTPEPPEPAKPVAKKTDEPVDAAADGWQLLLSPPILLNLVFFILLSMSAAASTNIWWWRSACCTARRSPSPIPPSPASWS